MKLLLVLGLLAGPAFAYERYKNTFDDFAQESRRQAEQRRQNEANNRANAQAMREAAEIQARATRQAAQEQIRAMEHQNRMNNLNAIQVQQSYSPAQPRCTFHMLMEDGEAVYLEYPNQTKIGPLYVQHCK